MWEKSLQATTKARNGRLGLAARWRASRLWAVLAVAVLAATLTGCPLPGQDSFEGISVYNETGQDIVLFWDDGRVETPLGEMAADHVGGRLVDMAEECVDMAIVARTDEGLEIARHGPPVCAGNNFVVERAASMVSNVAG